MKIAYTGPYAAVDVPALNATVKRGEAIEVQDGRLFDMLVKQGWQPVREEKENNQTERVGDDS